jgi:serine/threonine-protein kinase
VPNNTKPTSERPTGLASQGDAFLDATPPDGDTVMDFPAITDTMLDALPPAAPPAARGPTGTLLSAPKAKLEADSTLLDDDHEVALAATMDSQSISIGQPATTTRRTLGGATILPRLKRERFDAREIVSEAKDRYELGHRLGEGASGAVDLALDNDIQRKVAIKWLKATDSGEMILRFADEVRMVGHLEHPNIVPVHDVGRTEDGQYYFVMKHVEGQTLESIIDKLAAGDAEAHKRFSFEARTRIFTEVLKAVEFAHHHRIIHRDIKPANIMVGPYGEVMVMDWGIAKNIRQAQREPRLAGSEEIPDLPETGENLLERLYTTQNNTVIGTPLYMSPEQVRGQNDALDERSDIYSLCATFYELMTLRTYVTPQKSMKATLMAVLTDKPTHPMMVWSKLQPPTPVELGHFILKGLAKDPADRFQTIAEMRERLQLIREGYIPVQCPFTFTKRVFHGFLHQVDHHPILSLTALALLFSGLMVSGFYLSGSLGGG